MSQLMLRESYKRAIFLQDTIVLFDFHSVHNDEAYWDHPREFRPQRFLDEYNQFRPNNFALPFGLGKFTNIAKLFAKLLIAQNLFALRKYCKR